MANQDFQAVARGLGPAFAERAAGHDARDAFVADNYRDLKEKRLFSMMVPEELGGGGASLGETCAVLRELGRHCASTALALSMHQHLIAANVFKHRRGQPGGKMLEKVAAGELVLVSTGATDWLDSNGQARRVEGGYRVSGRKVFASGCPAADLLITSAAADQEPEGPSVLHFPVSMRAEGVRVVEDWKSLGMRATGSHSVVLEDVFVPDEAIALKRPQGQWHGAWDVVLGVAPPIYMSPYLGLAERAAELSLAQARSRPASHAVVTSAGELENALTLARLVWEDMIERTGDFQFQPGLEHTNAMLSRKTLLARAVRDVAEKAMELGGGAAFYRHLPLERLWRDAQAAHYHPLPEKRQVVFTGSWLLGLDVTAA